MKVRFRLFWIFVFVVSFVSVLLVYGIPTTPISENIDQALAECYQQLLILNKTLENVTKERDYYKSLYENISVNVTNFELIQIRNNINILNQRIEQLSSQVLSLKNSIRLTMRRYFVLGITFGSVFGSVVGTLVSINYYLKKAPEEKKKVKQSDEKKS
ncbi:hypothetical protein [Thermococcus barophilus]|uniref:Uncharacterized protein n=1 Tax=Thermococcus barophilus (strain DSM 11836 / MP) TaxID=391623 RepID=F0LNA3_THEBM|nr:hypothetical protein [Thermococcus barophilus]ADT85242.1 hypothetical protein TERMP_02269 [Thermococcus barophilus MP]